TAAPGSWWGLTRRSSSANEGPGSAVAANSGNGLGSDIGRGAYRGRSGAQGDDPLSRERGELVITIEVRRRRNQALDVVLELADTDVAVPAQNAAHAARLVVVGDVVGVGIAADG